MWSIEDLKECGELFGWNTRRGVLNWYDLEEDDYTSDVSLDCYEEILEALIEDIYMM